MSSQLPDNEVHLHWIDSAEIQRYDKSSYLDATEKKRAAAFKFDVDRQHYQVAHNWLCQLLSRYADATVSPAEWPFSYNAYGKP